MVALSVLYLSLYNSIAADATDFKSLVENYPPAVQAILGINLDYISSLSGFYTMVFSFITLCGTIQAMNLGVSILSKEARERTADFLLVKPVSRSSIIVAKLAAAYTTIITTDIIFYGVTFLLADIVTSGDYDRKLFILINLTMFLIQIILIAFGMLVSVFFRKIKNVLPISLGFVLGFYMIGVLLAGDKKEETLRFLSPYKYYDTTYIIENGRYETPYLLLGAAIVLVCIVASFLIYNRKDIHAVS
jgi:ABC-2 type transport system permease protein